MTSAGAPSRRDLPLTFHSWFGRFEGFREVQQRAIPKILAGHDVLLSSATASGKTEAYAAPAAEIAHAAGSPPAAVIIVSPTRALANDLHRRLEGPMERIGVPFGRWTGEHKEKHEGRLPTILVTTPEALDSMLARRPNSLASVRMIVIDEIHVMDGTARGDHLRVLLHRLENIATRRPQRVAASATVEEPATFAARYLREAEIVHVEGARRLRIRPFHGDDLVSMASHLDALARAGFKKILVFCRSRNRVEELSMKLRGRTVFQEHVYAHHGSMSRLERERTERNFPGVGAGVCFATMTLEMGIDIGTVDYVLNVGLAPDVSALMQRIGRGGRRRNEIRAGYVAADEAQDLVLRTMLTLGKQNRLCSRAYAFRPAVLAQQALVLAGSRTYLELDDLAAALPPAIADELGLEDPFVAARAVLQAMTDTGHLERQGSQLQGSERWVLSEEQAGHYERGRVHSNFSTEAGWTVIDRLTGDTLGETDRPDTRRLGLAGRGRKIAHVDHSSRSARVLSDRTAKAEPAKFRSAAKPSVSWGLAQAVIEHCGVPSASFAYAKIQGRVLLAHGLGTVGGRLLLHALRQQGAPGALEDCGAYTLWVERLPEVWPSADEAHWRSFLSQNWQALENQTGPGPLRESVPKEWRVTSVERTHALADLQSAIADAQLENAEDHESIDLGKILLLDADH